VDQRVKDASGKIKIILQNGQKVIMPPTLTAIPGLMLLDRNYQILYGDEIYKYLEPKQNTEIKEATENNMEPYSFSGSGGSSFVVSDNYSFLDQDLDSQGNGGMQQMHHYENLQSINAQQGQQGQQEQQGQQGQQGQQNFKQSDNIRESNNRIRDGEINTTQIAKQRGYNSSQAPGPGF